MAKLPLDLKGFKKVASDSKSSTLQHPQGHQITIAHAPLSPKYREQLAALPLHKADGGSVPEAPKKNAQAMQKGATSAHTLGQAWENFKGAISGEDSDEKAPPKKPLGLGDSQGAPGYAKGGQVKMYADGSKNEPVSQDDSAPTTDAPPAPQSPTGAPIVINVGQQPQIPASAINPTPGSQAGNYVPSNAEAPIQSGSQPFGTPPASDITQPTPNSQAPATPTAAPQHTSPAPTQSDPYGTQAQLDAFSKGAGEYKAGLAQQADAQGQASQGEAAALQQAVVQQKQAQQVFKDNYSALDTERKAFQRDIQNQHIDPQQYWAEKSTGSKIATAIGLILGGLGGSDAPVKFLNDNINRDIAAQQAELGKKENLLSANLKQFGNMRDATDMTRVMQTDIVANQFKEAAAKAGSAQAKAEMLTKAGMFDTQNAGLIGQMAMRKSLLTGMQSGQVDPSRVVMALVPQAEQGAAYKELQAAQNLTKSKDNLMSAFDQLQQLNTVGNRVTSPLQSSKQVAAIKEPLLAQLVKDSEGRITPQDTKMIDALFPAPGDNEQTSLMKRNQLNKFISEKMNFPMLQSYGINVGNMGRYSPQGQSRIQERPPVTK